MACQISTPTIRSNPSANTIGKNRFLTCGLRTVVLRIHEKSNPFRISDYSQSQFLFAQLLPATRTRIGPSSPQLLRCLSVRCCLRYSEEEISGCGSPPLPASSSFSSSTSDAFATFLSETCSTRANARPAGITVKKVTR